MTKFRLAMLSIAGFFSMLLVGPLPGHAAPPPQATLPESPCGLHFQKFEFTKTGPSASAVADMDGGLILETKVVEDSVNWKHTFSVGLPLPGVQMSYRTKKLDDGLTNAAALPAYRLYMTNMDGANATTTLVFEPYYQISGNPALNTIVTWDVDAGKFWSTKDVAGITAEAGGSYAGNKTLAQIMVANPSARIAAIGIGQGTYNAGTRAWVNTVRAGCATYVWKPVVASPSASASASKSASPSVSVSVGSSSGAVIPPVDTVGNSLPLTGTPIWRIVGLAFIFLSFGGGLIYFSRKRKGVRFQA